MKLTQIILWLLKLVAAVIMIQTLYFKFTGHEQSVRLFTEIGMEPWGRIGTGVMELVASVLLLIPATAGLGALLGIGLMSGAIFFHVSKIGLDFDGDYVLFAYAVITLFCCSIVAWVYRQHFLRFVPLGKR